MICRNAKAKMPDLLLAPESVAGDVRAHVESCAECGQELRELQATMAAMDAWEAPEVSPYFDGRMAAMLREEQAAAPAGWLERLRARLVFGEKMNLRPVAAAALALVIALGGGMFGVLSDHSAPQAQAASPVIQDLQSLDENAVVFQQLTSMDQQQDTGDSGTANPNSL